MHVCFHGGGGGGCKTVSFIRGLAKNMKAMSLKAGGGGGGGREKQTRRRRRRRRRRMEADGMQQQVQDHKEGSTAAGETSASAKITPADCEEEAGGGDERRRRDDMLRREKKGEQGEGGGRKQQEYCDKCCSPLLHDDDGGAAVVAGEWVAEPETGVLMTLAARPDGTNRLRRLRFREELFDSSAAQSWWTDNYDRVVELYSVVQSDGDSDDAASAVPTTPCQSEDDEHELPSESTSNLSGEPSSGSGSTGTVSSPILGLVTAPSGSKTPPPAAQHDGGEDQPWTEWVEEYEAGVFITVRANPGHLLQFRHVELSRERFGEVKARVWWEENKEKLHSLYSF